MTINIYGPLPRLLTKKETTQVGWSKIYGLVFPIGKINSGHYFSKQSGIELIKNNLNQLLLTEKGERLMLPNFGCSLRRFTFEPLDEQLFQEIKEEVITSISDYAPNVQIIKISVNPLDKFGVESLQAIQINLICKLIDQNNIVFDVGVRIG